MNYPEGFFTAINLRGKKILAFHCSKCRCTYLDIAKDQKVWCCGTHRALERHWWNRGLPVHRLVFNLPGAPLVTGRTLIYEVD